MSGLRAPVAASGSCGGNAAAIIRVASVWWVARQACNLDDIDAFPQDETEVDMLLQFEIDAAYGYEVAEADEDKKPAVATRWAQTFLGS